MTDKEDLLEILRELDIENYDFVIFKGEDGKGEISGLLMGTPELVQAVSEGFQDVEEVELEDDFFSFDVPKDEEIH